jgi:hypothetical protein
MRTAIGQTGLALSVVLDKEVAGGTWSLSIPTDAKQGVSLRVLDQGRVPDDGSLVIPVSGLGKRALARDETTFLHLSASRLADTKTAWVTAASVGLVGGEIAAGRTHQLRPVPPELVPESAGLPMVLLPGARHYRHLLGQEGFRAGVAERDPLRGEEGPVQRRGALHSHQVEFHGDRRHRADSG